MAPSTDVDASAKEQSPVKKAGGPPTTLDQLAACALSLPGKTLPEVEEPQVSADTGVGSAQVLDSESQETKIQSGNNSQRHVV